MFGRQVTYKTYDGAAFVAAEPTRAWLGAADTCGLADTSASAATSVFVSGRIAAWHPRETLHRKPHESTFLSANVHRCSPDRCVASDIIYLARRRLPEPENAQLKGAVRPRKARREGTEWAQAQAARRVMKATFHNTRNQARATGAAAVGAASGAGFCNRFGRPQSVCAGAENVGFDSRRRRGRGFD